MAINLEDHLDADHLAVLELLPGDLLDFSDVTAARARINDFMAHMPAPEIPDSVEVADHHAEAADGHEVLVRVYRPKQRRDRSPGLYWIHGGGMVLGDVGMDDASCAAIASDLDVVVASVDYRLAPEFPYPTPLEDCYRGLVWFFEQAEALGLDTARIAVGGASAGGGLAAGLALLAPRPQAGKPLLPAAEVPDARRPQRDALQLHDRRQPAMEPRRQRGGVVRLSRRQQQRRRRRVLRRSDPGDRSRRAPRRPSSPSAASTSSSTRTPPTPRRCSPPRWRASCTCTRARSTARPASSPIPTSPSAGTETRWPRSTGR